MRIKGTSKSWGGPRPIPDRTKPKSYDEKFKARLEKMLRKRAKSLGLGDPLEALADLALNPNYQDAVRASVWKIIAETYTVKHSHNTVEEIKGPLIMLPPLAPKPMPPKEEEESRHNAN